jgi:hypothetical protein
MGVQWRTGR